MPLWATPSVQTCTLADHKNTEFHITFHLRPFPNRCWGWKKLAPLATKCVLSCSATTFPLTITDIMGFSSMSRPWSISQKVCWLLLQDASLQNVSLITGLQSIFFENKHAGGTCGIMTSTDDLSLIPVCQSSVLLRATQRHTYLAVSVTLCPFPWKKYRCTYSRASMNKSPIVQPKAVTNFWDSID